MSLDVLSKKIAQTIYKYNIGLSNYIADYVNKELSRGNEVDWKTIADAINAYNGGAR